jgi:hypothetical protein
MWRKSTNLTYYKNIYFIFKLIYINLHDLKTNHLQSMKKLFVFAIAAGMTTFAACNSGASSESADSTATTAVDTVSAAPVDSSAMPVDSTMADSSAATTDSTAH